MGQSFLSNHRVGNSLIFTAAWPLIMIMGLCGCADFEKPIYDVGTRKLIPIPFRDETAHRDHRWYGESEKGIQVVRYFRAWTQDEHVGNFVSNSDEGRVVRNVTRWPENRIRPADWRKLLAGVDADLILIGTITEFRFKQPNDVNVYRGSAKIEYRIIDAISGKTQYVTPTPREVRFPEAHDFEIPYTDLDQKHKKSIHLGLIIGLGEKLGKELYGYYDE